MLGVARGADVMVGAGLAAAAAGGVVGAAVPAPDGPQAEAVSPKATTMSAQRCMEIMGGRHTCAVPDVSAPGPRAGPMQRKSSAAMPARVDVEFRQAVGGPCFRQNGDCSPSPPKTLRPVSRAGRLPHYPASTGLY